MFMCHSLKWMKQPHAPEGKYFVKPGKRGRQTKLMSIIFCDLQQILLCPLDATLEVDLDHSPEEETLTRRRWWIIGGAPYFRNP